MKDMLKEHLWCRESAGITDLSHMGQVRVQGELACDFLESLTVANLRDMHIKECKLTLIMNEHGGIKDDCIITKEDYDSYFMVLNAISKEKVIDFMKQQLNVQGWKIEKALITYNEDHDNLLSVQGPKA